MLRRIITIILLGIPPPLLMRWDGHHGHHVPKWLMAAVCAPLAIALLIWEDDDVSDTGRAIGNWVLFLMGMFALGIGIFGFAMRHESAVFLALAWMFPVGAVMTIAAVVRALRD
ncbi:hypothetical protein ACS5PN_13845 [Roseateles sp. NT4]|uniref:hypothetical protein n=1 Tax=Roseateles sp. NT4 TaxID=3453715 RepID=UPI003EEEA244